VRVYVHPHPLPPCPPPDSGAILILVALLAAPPVAVLAFRRWRRASAPLRTILFVVYVLCALFVADMFALLLVLTPLAPACRA